MSPTADHLSLHQTPGAALAAQAAAAPGKVALSFPGQGKDITYGDWFGDATAVARALLGLGYGPGDHIGLLSENRAEWPVVQVAAALLGAVLVPLNTHYRRDDLADVLDRSDIACLFVSEAFRNSAYLEMVQALRPGIPALRTLICFDRGDRDVLDYRTVLADGREAAAELPEVDPWSVGSLQFTSGTTGLPKGALLTQAGMMGNAWGISGRLGITLEDIWTSFIPLFHCAGCIMCVLGTLQRGCRFISTPSFDPVETCEIIQRERVTVLSGVPTSYIAMLDHPKRGDYDLSSLRTGTCGGADTDPAMLQQCAESFPVPGVVQVYGQTESSTLISLADWRAPERWETAGPPLPGAEVRITDARTGVPMPAGEIGQIETAGPMVMRGYYKNPDATAATIGEDGWMRTGDLGYLTPEGNVVVAGGRLRDMIIRGGENIYPVEIENLLREHPAVTDVAVFGVPDRYYGEIVAAAVQLQADATPEDLAAWCTGRIAGFKAPAVWYRVDSFPLTASGKIRKTELQSMAAEEGLTPLG